MLKTKIVTILLLAMLFSTTQAIAEEAETYTLTVHISGQENYTITNELVIIREYGQGGNTSPVLTQDYTGEGGFVQFELESGDYWVDVRNVWVPVSLEEDWLFEFPYKLFADPDNNQTDTNGTEPEEQAKTNFIYWILGLGIIVGIILLAIYFKRNR